MGRQRVDPTFEFERGPVLLGAAVAVVCGTIALVGFARPAWLLPSSIFAGVAAGLASGYYSQTSTNGFVAVALGFLVLFPVLVAFRAATAAVVTGVSALGPDAVLLGIGISLGDLIVILPLALVFGFLGATAVDVLRSRFRTPRGTR